MNRSLELRRELLVVAVAVVVLMSVVFGDTFMGSVIPVFDFVSHYNFEAYAWWHDGSFFAPAQWMPYLWGGYPSVSNLQNSSFYIPVGMASLFGPYSLHSAGVVSALHVAFGAVGAYVFARRFGAGWPAALFALVAWFFAAGAYSNASHVDIARGYAWLPWVFLVASTHWPWRRWWGPLLALLVLSQALLGIYPGMIVAILYCALGWIVVQQVTLRPRVTAFLLPLAIVAFAAALTTLVRFLPWLLTRGGGSTHSDDLSIFPVSGIGTFLFPYGLADYGGMAIFMSHFLPVGVIALAPFLRRWSAPIVALVVPVTVALLLGMPFWPWHDLVRALPGLDLSRFMESDFKVVLLFGLTMIAVFVLDQLLHRQREGAEGGLLAPGERSLGTRSPRVLVPAGLLLAAVAGFIAVGMKYEFKAEQVVMQVALLAAAGAIVAALATRHSRPWQVGLAAALVVATAGSGLAAVSAESGLWRQDRIANEIAAFEGPTVEQLMAERVHPGPQRPPRTPPPPPDYPQNNLESKWSRAFYTGVPSLYGYVNLRAETFDIVRAAVDDNGAHPVEARAFWTAGGMVVETPGDSPPSPDLSYTCFSAGDCGDHLTTEPVAYGPASTIVYHVVTDEPVSASANEAWYPGWHLTLCPTSGGEGCIALANTRGEYGQIQFELPAGDWQLTLDYRLPGLTIAWLLFGFGLLIAVALSVAPVIVRKRTAIRGGTAAAGARESSRSRPPGPATG